MRIILLTGQPSVGKTTMVSRLADYFIGKGSRVAGITTREVRESGVRVGFKITDLYSHQEGWLARKDSSTGPRIGSYRVVSEDLDAVGVNGLRHATDDLADLIIVDEIGPMEMTSPPFRATLARVFIGERPVVATVKFGSTYAEVEKVRDKSTRLEITKDNRETIYQHLIERVNEWIKPSGS